MNPRSITLPALLLAAIMILGALPVFGDPGEDTARGELISVESIRDFGSDTNGDGSFEILSLEISVVIGKAQIYSIYGTIVGPLITSDNSTFLPLGNETLMLNFVGMKIFKAGMDGPYAIRIIISNGD